MKMERLRFLETKKFLILLQQKYWAILAMRKERTRILVLKEAVIILQINYKARLKIPCLEVDEGGTTRIFE
jgi:hypothetical protein